MRGVNIVFRTDASLQIGSGHLMRCLTLAKALRKKGAQCRFVCRVHPGHFIDLLCQEGFSVLELPLSEQQVCQSQHNDLSETSNSAWLGSSWQEDAHQTIEALAVEQVDWLLVDHYALDKGWELELRPYTKKIMVIDDLADRVHDCDLLLDQNWFADPISRYEVLLPEHCAVLFGPDFALLQSDYTDLHLRVPPRHSPVKRILIYFGGADIHNLTGRAILAFLSLERADIFVDVVINPKGLHASTVREIALSYSNISVYEFFPTLAPLMLKADLAIGAGGATSLERICLGLPSLVITLAENQKLVTDELNCQGLVNWLGHYDTVSEQALAEALQDTLEKTELGAWSLACLATVDGKGTDRIVSILLLGVHTALKVRLVRLEDELLLLHWANDPLVRRQAFHPEIIAADVHRQWFYGRLRDFERCRIYIIETEEGFPIGQVRFDLKENGWEIGYSIDQAARGRKLGKKMLEAAMFEFRYEQPRAQIFGRVKRENKPSQKIFKELGFDEQRGEQFIYHRIL